MDVRNREELLKKQENLEAYLLENPQSQLFAWYARQNMEAGELDRALKICKLGLQGKGKTGVIHKLMGEIYMAKGEVTLSMKHMIECLLTKEPFPGVIIEVMKNFSDTLEADQIAFLVHLLNQALPGHPEATRYYEKHPDARYLPVQADQYNFLENLAANLEHSAKIEVLPDDEEDHEETVPQVEAVEEKQAEAVIVTEEPESTDDPFNIPQEQKVETPAPAPPVETPSPKPVPEPAPRVETPTPASKPRPVSTKKPVIAQSPAVKHNVTRSMATFTLMQIFKSQGMYENALEVLQLLREKSTNTERINSEEKEIRELLAKAS